MQPSNAMPYHYSCSQERQDTASGMHTASGNLVLKAAYSI